MVEQGKLLIPVLLLTAYTTKQAKGWKHLKKRKKLPRKKERTSTSLLRREGVANYKMDNKLANLTFDFNTQQCVKLS